MEARGRLFPILVAVALTAVLPLTVTHSASAASSASLKEPRLSIASPAPGTLVGGLVPVTVAFDAGRFGKVTSVELWVDDLFYANVPLEFAQGRGTCTLDLDTLRLRNGQHTLKLRSLAGRRVVATDEAVVTVSNGGVDIVPPIVSFYAPLEGQTLTGTASIGVNAVDNDQVSLVSISVNRSPVLLKSHPPFTYSLDTTTLPLQDRKGMITLEAMAIDRSNNVGKAKSIRVFVNNPANATPLQADPPDPAATKSPRTTGTSPAPRAGGATAPSRPQVARLPKVTPGGDPPAAVPTEPRRIAGPSAPPVTTARLPRPQPSDQSAVAAQQPLAATTAGSRTSMPSAAFSRRPSRRLALGPVGTPTPRSSGAVQPRPLLMARAILPMAAPAERHAPVATTQPTAAAPERSRTTTGTTPRLSASRVATPTAASRPITSTPPAPTPAPSTRLATLPRQAPVGSPSVAPGRVALPVFVARPVPDSPSRSRTYRIRSGDRLPAIAHRFRVTPQSILVANGLQDGSSLRPGRKLMIPGTFDIVVDSRRIEFDVSPRIEKGLPIAPFRQVFEQTGGVVVYYPGDHSVKAARTDREVRLQIGSEEALVNGAVVLMERPASIDSGRTMVPVRFVTEALDMVAEYDVKTGNIFLVRK